MKKQTTSKIILGLIIFVFVVSIFEIASPVQAATTSMSDLYSNPNQGSNAYKFKISDVVNSNLLTQVVGCTDIVSKVSTWMASFLQSATKHSEILANTFKKTREQLKSACSAGKAGAEGSAGSVPTVNNLVKAVDTALGIINVNVGGYSVKVCQDQVDSTSDDQLQEMAKQTQQQAEAQKKAQCFDGIAATLAKNQLTAMTRSMMNWVNTGYGGNPFFVQNMTNLTNKIEKDVLENGINALTNTNRAYPYGTSFARSAIDSYKTGSALTTGATSFLDTLTSDLSNFITDPNSVPSDKDLDKANSANDAFANDFSTGGWNGWLALTQKDQNNPLGFTMKAAEFLQDQQTQQTQNTKDELAQNNGFLSQKTCILWQKVDANGDEQYNEDGSKLTTKNGTKTDLCLDYKIITPGSIIKDKTTNYLNSPERQLELAKTINDSLNALFSVLISKLEGGGLSGLSDSVENTTNWTDNLNSLSNLTSADGNSTYNNNGAYNGFNLTRDLGNTYIHDSFTSLGTWNANTNITSDSKKLYPDLGPEKYDTNGKAISYPNTYYTVTTAGNTKLMVNGYNDWAVGDRAFWDGTEWQNWKKDQSNPIKKRGVIQIQQDYVVAAKAILKVLPKVMSNLGELDYCIPGPNPNYKINSTDAETAYQNWVGSMYVGPRDTSRNEWRIDGVGTQVYNDLTATYKDNQNVWKELRDNSDISVLLPSGSFKGFYGYDYNPSSSELDDEATFKNLRDNYLSFVNNNMFNNFYEVFDKMMNKLYFNNMTKENLEDEANGVTGKNPAYVPMAQSGLDLTKNILYYNDDITKATEEYTDAINQAKINIDKLKPIQDEVSKIIIAAQNRRDLRLLAQINTLNAPQKNACESAYNTCEYQLGVIGGGDTSSCLVTYNTCLSNIKPLTPAEYKAQYASCLDEENIQVYDADAIMNTGAVDTERCNNGIDDDLNGLIDTKDPACKNYNSTNNNSVSNGQSYYYRIQSCQDNQIYELGPALGGLYNSGNRVEGASGMYYVVTGSNTEKVSGAVANIGVTNTNLQGCPR